MRVRVFDQARRDLLCRFSISTMASCVM
jgi:hypothetical protein